jgi:hypothetical protein
MAASNCNFLNTDLAKKNFMGFNLDVMNGNAYLKVLNILAGCAE